MYKLHLIQKYLLKRRIAWVALAAVTLCTAMVLVVVSVMGGWLETFQNSFHAMTGDVVISGRSTLVGFPYYEQICRAVTQECKGVEAAVPTVSSYGLINIGSRRINMVQVVGYPADIGAVSPWPTLLHRQAPAAAGAGPTTAPAGAGPTTAPAGKPDYFRLLDDMPYESLLPAGASPAARRAARNRPGMIVTGPVVGITHGSEGEADQIRDVMVGLQTTLTLLPVSPDESIRAESAVSVPFWIVDDAKSRVYQLDNQNVYVDFDEAQRDLRMDGGDGNPARCTQVLIRAKPGYALEAVRDDVRRVAQRVTGEQFDAAKVKPFYRERYGYVVETWAEQQGEFIKAVKHEVVLTTALFGVISMVAVLLIFCIFYMIVVEKTRDIGILKSVGATGGGIMALFLGYGLAIGVVGAALGVTIAYFFVLYINELHAWLGRRTGLEIWSPKTYQFDRIPSHMNTSTIVWVVVVALVSATVGALLPAVRAAILNPVDSLRYE